MLLSACLYHCWVVRRGPLVGRDHEVKYVIDAGDIGGVARYINHSCDVRPSTCVPNPVHLMHFLPMGGRIVEDYAVTRRPKVLPGLMQGFIAHWKEKRMGEACWSVLGVAPEVARHQAAAAQHGR